MKIIFISINNVLFTASDKLKYSYFQKSEIGDNFFKRHEPNSIEAAIVGISFASKKAISNLLTLVKENNAGIVITSAWQKGRTLADIKKILNDTGLADYVVGKTYLKDPSDFTNEEDYLEYTFDFEYNYAKQILNWLEEQKNLGKSVNDYIVISDHGRLKENFRERYIEVTGAAFDDDALRRARVALQGGAVNSTNTQVLANSMSNMMSTTTTKVQKNEGMEIEPSLNNNNTP